MKASLSATCKSLQQEMDSLRQPDHDNETRRERSLDFIPKLIKYADKTVLPFVGR